ncbi:MAG: iron-sulfur cluster assembly accessory protein [bacterium]|nr:iron-sulfur cluster assembly accessory protein [bacterium]
MAITLTEKAAREVDRIIAQQQEDTPEGERKPKYLRVGVKGGGCSGFSYTLDLTEDAVESDEHISQHGVELVCDPKSYLYLKGTTIDFKDDIMDRGFEFRNPNATSSCGCGSSFSA